MNLCTSCGRVFGGTFAYDRHLDRRADRCRNSREMRARGLQLRDGVWHRADPTKETAKLPGLGVRA